MKIYHTTRPNSSAKFRCNSCRVAFTPTPRSITHCPTCEAGRDLYRALQHYQATTAGVRHG